MSAFMVRREHIDALVELATWGPSKVARYPGSGWGSGGFGLRWWTVDAATLRTVPLDAVDSVAHSADPETADVVGAMLVAENLASIHHRYPDTLHGGPVPGPAEPYWDLPYVFHHVRPAPTAVEGLKLIACYEYQACEHPEWPASEAQSFCNELRCRLIGVLDEYDAAPWEWPGR